MASTAWVSMLLTSVCSTIVGYYWFVYRKRRINVPVQWKLVGKVENIIIYPVKSGALKHLKVAQCTETGLSELTNETKLSFHDRCFILYDENFKALKMASCKISVGISVDSIDHDTIVFYATNMSSFHLRLSEFLSSPRKVKISYYDCIFEAVDCGELASKWMSQFLLGANKGYRLGYFFKNICQSSNTLQLMKGYSDKMASLYEARENFSGYFADLASYMIISANSVADVNSKLPLEDRFQVGNLRPNIVVSDSEKYAEDDWKWIKIGNDVVLKIFKPCTRCVKITINPENGLANKNLQPFKLLKTYRTVKQLKGHDVEGSSPILGAYAGLIIPGEIKIGDAVYANSC